MARGCAAAGYRLAGQALDHVCCRHLRAEDRMLTVWPALDHAVVIAVGPHDCSVTDVYDGLLAALAIVVPIAERSKPPCCDEAGEPPADRDRAVAIADAVDALGRGRRRPR